MGLMMSEGKFVGRDEIALVPTPEATASWKPVPHSDVIDAVTEVVKAHRLADSGGAVRSRPGWSADVRRDADQPHVEHGVEPLHRHPQQSRSHTGTRIECRVECQSLFKSHVWRQYDLEASPHLPDRAERPGSGGGEFA